LLGIQNKTEAKDVLPPKGQKNAVFAPGDLDLQTCPNKGPNTSSMWIWCKSVQQFPGCFIHKQKKSQTAPKTEPYTVHSVQ